MEEARGGWESEEMQRVGESGALGLLDGVWLHVACLRGEWEKWSCCGKTGWLRLALMDAYEGDRYFREAERVPCMSFRQQVTRRSLKSCRAPTKVAVVAREGISREELSRGQ